MRIVNVLTPSLPMWIFTVLFFPVVVHAQIPSSYSTALGETAISRFSSEMEAQSPGVAAVRVVHHQDLNKRILISLVVACILLVGIFLLLISFWIHRRKKLKSSDADSVRSSEEAGTKGSITVFEYQLLEAATDKFDHGNVLDGGGRGHVYRARFRDKSLAAVKQLDGSGPDVEKEFENEINWLSRLHHQNVISLLGCCAHGQSRYLVYEMMQNGSLEAQLHGPSHGSALTWHLRIKIAVDVARGLEYLHEHCNPPLIHRDLKSSNILLDSNFDAKISDFGLAITAGSQNKSIKLSGTLGYAAPEYLLDGKLTDKSDVYAFGVVLLELLMGRKPVEKVSTSQYQSIVTWAMPKLTDRSKLPDIVDPMIRNTMDLKHLYQVAAVAVLCVQPEPSYRPLITDVLYSLIPLVPIELGGSLRVT